MRAYSVLKKVAKSFGADVTGVSSTSNVEMLRSIGADQVIDYADEDFTKSGQHYDLRFSTAMPTIRCQHTGADIRRCWSTRGPGRDRDSGSFDPNACVVVTGSQKLVTFLAKPSKEDLTILRELVANGKVTPVIDRCYSLNEVPEAMRYLEEGHARGKVAITLD
jgi:NADPH:quinone reductase-like Zn-dependent oxidoreductase